MIRNDRFRRMLVGLCSRVLTGTEVEVDSLNNVPPSAKLGFKQWLVREGDEQSKVSCVSYTTVFIL